MRPFLTHGGRDKMAAIFQTTFSNTFYWTEIYEFRLRLHWSLLPSVQLTIFQHLFREWLGAGHIGSDNGLAPARRQAIIWTNVVSLLTHICVTRTQWVLIPLVIGWTNSGVREWMSNHINRKLWDVIIHPHLNFNGGLAKPLKLGQWWITLFFRKPYKCI